MPDRLGFKFGPREMLASLRPGVLLFAFCLMGMAYFVAADVRSRRHIDILHAENERSKDDRAALNARVATLESAVDRFIVQSKANHEETRQLIREEFRRARESHP